MLGKVEEENGLDILLFPTSQISFFSFFKKTLNVQICVELTMIYFLHSKFLKS